MLVDPLTKVLVDDDNNDDDDDHGYEDSDGW